MTKYDLVTPDIVRQLLDYDPETGNLVWRERPDAKANWNARNAGRAAFTTADRLGYKTGVILSKRFFAHRVAIAHATGSWPRGEVDHINQDTSDNRLVNLREVTRTQNRRNLGKAANNTSGVTGVHWASNISKWVAQISVGRKKRYLGAFTRLEDAVAARKASEQHYGFHENHGKRRKA